MFKRLFGEVNMPIMFVRVPANLSPTLARRKKRRHPLSQAVQSGIPTHPHAP